MKNIDYSKYSAGELEAMLGQIDKADQEIPEGIPKNRTKDELEQEGWNQISSGASKAKRGLEKGATKLMGLFGVSEEEYLENLKKQQERAIQDSKDIRALNAETTDTFVRPAGMAVRGALGGVGSIVDIARSGLEPLDITKKIDTASDNYFKPEGPWEKRLDTVAGAAAALPLGGPQVKIATAALSKAQKAARFLQGLIAKQKITPVNVAGAGAASIAGKYMAEENPLDLENPIAKQAASLAASMGAGIIPHTAVPLVQSAKKIGPWAATKAATLGDIDQAAVEHAREAGIDLLPTDALRSKWAKRQEKIMGSIPFVGGKIQKAMEKRYEQSLEALGQSSPGRLSKETGADLVLKGSEANYETHKTQFNKEYSDIGKKISSNERKAELAEAPIREKYVAAEEELASEIKILESAKKTLILTPKQHSDLDGHLLELRKAATDSKQQLNNLSKEHLVDPKNALSYLESIRNKFKTETMREKFDASPIGQRRQDLIKMAKENNGFVPYEDIVGFRRIVDESINNFGIHGKISPGQRKRLSGLINEDVGMHLRKIDPELESAWKNVNERYSTYSEKVLPAINKVLKNEKGGTDLGGLMSILPNKENGGKALKNVLDHLKSPREKQQLFDIVIRTAGLDNKGNFSMVKAYNYFNSLTPTTRGRLLAASGKSPQEIKKYKSVMETINNVWKSSQEENFSGSGKHLIQHGITTSLAFKIGSGNYLGAAKTIGAIALATAGTAGSLKNNNLINSMYIGFKKANMTSHEFYDWCRKVGKADPEFGRVINKTLGSGPQRIPIEKVIKPSAINAAKSHVAKEITAGPVSYETPELPQDVAPTQDAPIDYSQYSIEELEDMQHQISEGQ